MKLRWISPLLFLVMASAAHAQGEVETIKVSVAQQAWTRQHLYEGDVAVFEVQGKYYGAKFDASGQWGSQGNESLYLRVAAITREQVRDLSSNGYLKTGVELGDFQISRDLPLGERAYVEIAPAKIFGTLGFSPKFAPELELIAKASLAVGYAHATAVDSRVGDTSNLYLGKEWSLTAKHERLGTLIFDRGVDGESKKYDLNRTGSREANVRLAYEHPLFDLGTIGFEAEKVSFSMGGANEVGPRYNKEQEFRLTFQRSLRR